jgi:hypothetical protein
VSVLGCYRSLSSRAECSVFDSQYEPVDTLVPPMPAGEEYDPDTERERQEAWRAYYAAMTTYEGNSPAMGVGLGLERSVDMEDEL